MRGGGESQAFCKVCMGLSEILNNLKTIMSLPGELSEQQNDWNNDRATTHRLTRDNVQRHLGSHQARATFGRLWGGSLVPCVWVSASSVPTAGQKPRCTDLEPSADQGLRGAHRLNVLGGTVFSQEEVPPQTPSRGHRSPLLGRGLLSQPVGSPLRHTYRTAWDP